jgi:Tol biopolymer transport system component
METGHERVVVAGLVGEIIDDLAWSPDGTRLAFSVSRAKALDSSATRNIYVYDLEQDELLQFSFGDNDFDPAWAPNGKEIAYLHLPPGETYPSVVLSQVDGSCSTEIAGLQGISSIAWSPDGSQLAHSKSTGIYILDLAAVFGEHFLTTGPTCESPT